MRSEKTLETKVRDIEAKIPDIQKQMKKLEYHYEDDTSEGMFSDSCEHKYYKDVTYAETDSYKLAVAIFTIEKQEGTIFSGKDQLHLFIKPKKAGPLMLYKSKSLLEEFEHGLECCYGGTDYDTQITSTKDTIEIRFEKLDLQERYSKDKYHTQKFDLKMYEKKHPIHTIE